MTAEGFPTALVDGAAAAAEAAGFEAAATDEDDSADAGFDVGAAVFPSFLAAAFCGGSKWGRGRVLVCACARAYLQREY